MGLATGNHDLGKPDFSPDYQCEGCGTTGVKLWMPGDTFQVHLLCCDCAASQEGVDIGGMDANGLCPSDLLAVKTDQIGWYVPAIPTPELAIAPVYWAYSHVPEEDYCWWKSLPNRQV